MKQKHTMEGPPEEFINEYDTGIRPPEVHPPTPAPAKAKRGLFSTIGKIFSFLHR